MLNRSLTEIDGQYSLLEINTPEVSSTTVGVYET